MKLLNLAVASLLTRAVLAIPATPDAPATTPEALATTPEVDGPVASEIVETGITADGVPYTITESFRKLTDEEIEEAQASASKGETTSITKRQSNGTGFNCNQEWNRRLCFCTGAIAGTNEVWQGMSNLCNAIADGPGLWGHTEGLRILWLPHANIETRIRNWSGDTYKPSYSSCLDTFVSLRAFCQEPWLTHKGGYWDRPPGHPVRYEFDVNGR
ncbi:hypothetical protein B0I35DRAFT_481204 [Stachybotrys elegans]|uniref:Cyanovirin-N domain-containing protein n=1 Tax=Stachybotrys elegans TaxID=80388 RepID=A0A8K0SQ91_9HYPO|nr:hypothetical protein B0I35DRAFT_481204 [Stachybotrys elegans]